MYQVGLWSSMSLLSNRVYKLKASHTHIHTYTHTYTHTYIHTQSPLHRFLSPSARNKKQIEIFMNMKEKK